MKDSTSLDAAPDRPGYTVFGKVTGGMEVADEIELVPTGLSAGMQNVPKEPVVIETIRRVEPTRGLSYDAVRVPAKRTRTSRWSV